MKHVAFSQMPYLHISHISLPQNSGHDQFQKFTSSSIVVLHTTMSKKWLQQGLLIQASVGARLFQPIWNAGPQFHSE